MLPVALLAGGLGTRLRSLTGDQLPKALVPVAGRPFIDWKLQELREQGVEDVVLLVGHGASPLEGHVGDGSRHGVRVRYSHDGPVLQGTGGALRAALPQLPDAFWVGYADTLLQVPMAEAEDAFRASGLDGLMTVLENRDSLETSNTSVSGGRVTAYDKPARPGTHEHIDYGLLILTKAAFDGLPNEAFDLGAVIHRLVEEGRLGAFQVAERFRDVGTPEAHAETEAYLRLRYG